MVFGASTIEVAVNFHESWTFPVIAVIKPLAWLPNFIDSWHISSGAENLFRFISFRYFFEDSFH